MNASNPDESMGDGRDAGWPAVVAEASAWIALLHGPGRTRAAEEGLKRWLAESERHRLAFEQATETWSASRAAIRRAAKVSLSFAGDREQRQRMPVRRYLAAAAAVLIAVALGTYFYFQNPGIATGIGERRTFALEDGTQVFLNTATRMVVEYSEKERRVRLESGEALFDVARRPNRPFVVSVGNRQVTALGTSFLVRRDPRRIAVTLVEGKVSVSAEGGLTDTSASGSASVETHDRSRSGRAADASEGAVVLDPGQRLVLADHARPVVDRPELEKLTAWQRGKVHIDNLTLADAVVEMNRYNTVALEVRGDAASIRMSGVFRVGDSGSFARAVALTHGLTVTEEDRRIVLSGTPRAPSESELDSSVRAEPVPR